MPYELCRHIKASGRRCQAPCVNDQFWCFFHARLHFRHRAVRTTKPSSAPSPLVLPVIEDRHSVQVAASLIAGALATGHIDEKRAAAILRALQLASRNLSNLLSSDVHPDRTVRSYVPTLDGLELAQRSMSDGSSPPRLEPVDPTLPTAS